MYTVKELSRLTGLTPRTLRYYDAIGLLSPARNRDNDYRLYGGAEVDRLQEILLYREMGLPLEEIGRILDAPDHDRNDSRRPARTSGAPPGTEKTGGGAHPVRQMHTGDHGRRCDYAGQGKI